VSELAALAADFGRVAQAVDDEGEKVVSKGALNIKEDTRARWAGHRHAPTLAASVTYDLTRTAAGVSAEIGPDKDLTGGGPLGTIYEYGTPHSAPRPALNPALDAEEPNFVRALEDLAERLLAG
jgi:HK97 gp10 family phage protein